MWGWGASYKPQSVRISEECDVDPKLSLYANQPTRARSMVRLRFTSLDAKDGKNP